MYAEVSALSLEEVEVVFIKIIVSDKYCEGIGEAGEEEQELRSD